MSDSEICLDSAVLEESYSTPVRRSRPSTSQTMSPSPERATRARFPFAEAWMKFCKLKARQWDDQAATKMLDWMAPYRRQPFYPQLESVEKALCNRAYQITSYWEEKLIPNLTVSSQVPTLTLLDLGYSEVQCTTTQIQNVIDFYTDFWNQTQGVLEELGLSATTPAAKRPRLDHISTSSTIARFTEANAGANSSPDLALFNKLSTVYAQNNLVSGTSSVSSNITLKKGNTFIASYLETEERPFQICLRCYRTEDVKGLNSLEKYKKAYVSISAHVNGHSQLHQIVDQMAQVCYKEMENQGARQTTYVRS